MKPERLLPIAAAMAVVLICAALVYYEASPEGYWSWDFARDSFYHIVGGALLAGALRIGSPVNAAPALTAIVFLYVLGGIGVPSGLSALLFASASLLLGRQVLRAMFPGQAVSATAAMICGLAVYLTVFGVMIHFTVNYRVVYLLLMGAPFVAEVLAGHLPPLRQQAHDTIENTRTAIGNLPYWMFALAVIAFLLIARIGFFPSAGFDDHALHLRLLTQLRYEHRFGFDFMAQVWEVAPFVVDLLHAAIGLVADAESRGATNLLLLGILLRQSWAVLGAFQLGAAQRLLVIGLILSTPMTSELLLSQQTELFMAAMAMAAVRLIFELRGNWCSPHTAALLAIAALCCAAKLPGAVLGVALLVPAILRLWSTRREAERPAACSMLLFAAFMAGLAVLAFNSYVTAWLKTSNPLFPLYNAIFQSPYFPLENFADTRWIKGFSFTTYWDLFFNTSGYSESRNFVAGFHYLLLMPLGMLSLLCVRALRPYAMPLLVPLLGFGLAMFSATQYWRYQFPVLPLGAVAIAALLVPRYSRGGSLLVHGSLLACIALNLVFYPGVSSFLREAPGRIWTTSGKQVIRERYAAPQLLNEWLNRNAPGNNVLYPEGFPYGATLHGKPVYVNWYSPATADAFASLRDEAEGLAFLRDRQIEYVIGYSTDPGLPGTRAWALRGFLARYGLPLAQAGNHILYRVDGGEIRYVTAYRDTATHIVEAEPRRVGSVGIGTATAVRYNAEFACAGDAGYFGAQISWDNGTYYYHEVPCSTSSVHFVEAVPVPPGATGGELWGRVSGTASATLTQLIIETR